MTIEQAAIKILQDCGVPSHLSGFRYLQTAVAICYNDCEKLGLVTKVLYPEVAKVHRLDDWRRVERCIRVAIRKSHKGSLSNSMFISDAVWTIKQFEEPPL